MLKGRGFLLKNFLPTNPEIIFVQHKQVGVANRAHIGCPSVAILAASNVQNWQFAEDCAFRKRGKHFESIVSNHLEHSPGNVWITVKCCCHSPLHNVHLPSNVPFAAHIIPRAEHLQLQFQHQLGQQSSFTILKKCFPHLSIPYLGFAWKMRTLRSVSKWTCMAISACNLSGNTLNTWASLRPCLLAHK